MRSFLFILIFSFFITAFTNGQPLIKCGLSHLAEKINAGELTKPLSVTRDNLQKSIISPSGIFRIHYDTTGINRPFYSVDDLASAFDSAFSYEVNYLGFPAPPSDGDIWYDIYIVNLGSIYGETVPENEITPGSSRYTSYIRIENDFAGFPTTGTDAARVTAAHELHHAIQIGNYVFRASDIFFHELTSTALEEEVFPAVNDYINYLPEYLNATYRQFSDNSGYNLAIWNLFLAQKFSYSLIKRQWEFFRTTRALLSISESLLLIGSSFKKELAEFGVWTFFSGYRTIPGRYFADAAKFPRLRNFASFNFTPPVLSMDLNLKPLSNSFILITGGNDSLIKIITREDVNSAVNTPDNDARYSYTLFNYDAAGSSKIAEGYWQSSSAYNLSFFAGRSILNNKLADSTGTPVSDKMADVYPSPFRESANPNGYIYFNISQASVSQADLYIYSSSMDEIFRSSVEIPAGAESILPFKIIDLNLASGVYIYFLSSGDFQKKGKFVYINE